MIKQNFRVRTAARQKLVQALYQWQLAGHNLSDIEQQFMEEQDMRRTDIAYFHDLLHAIPPLIQQLNTNLAPFLDREIEQLDPTERAILWLGCYELQNCAEVPFKVVINECVELAKKFGADDSFRYINGVLDKLAYHLANPSQPVNQANKKISPRLQLVPEELPLETAKPRRFATTLSLKK